MMKYQAADLVMVMVHKYICVHTYTVIYPHNIYIYILARCQLLPWSLEYIPIFFVVETGGSFTAFWHFNVISFGNDQFFPEEFPTNGHNLEG